LLISSQAFAASDNSISTNYGIKEFGAYSLIIGNLKNNTINSKKAEDFRTYKDGIYNTVLGVSNKVEGSYNML
jgi:hypothetical protein